MLLLLVRFFVTIHFVLYNLKQKSVLQFTYITDAKPKQMKLTEHSCCFDNEDDGNFWRDERLCDSPMRWF